MMLGYLSCVAKDGDTKKTDSKYLSQLETYYAVWACDGVGNWLKGINA